ncbi:MULTISPECIES: DUF2993 domain-containing protein [unclassified Streptomyces]|uniref:LmeA family phospholipid-binding protein n=1 Tax=unclassified Streptomyces TaxID=2593676 RepID=UPI003801151D
MRALRILLIIAVVLGGLFVAADRLAVGFAESEAADRIRASRQLASTPEVSIHGFPFLTQLAGGELHEVEVSMTGITATADGREVDVTEVRAKLRDVRIGSGFSSAVAGSAEGSARISYEDLSEAAPEGAVVGYAGAERAAKGQVELRGRLVEVLEGAGVPVPGAVEALLGDREVSTYSTVTLVEGSTVRLRAEALPELPVPGLGERLRKVVDYDLEIGGLPTGIELDTVRAGEGGLSFAGKGTDITLTG